MGKIQDNLREYMDEPYNKIVCGGTFKVLDFNNLVKVLDETDENFLIFDNGGGKKFEIRFDQMGVDPDTGESTLFEVKKFIEHIVQEHRSWVYCYQLNKEQTIIRKIE